MRKLTEPEVEFEFSFTIDPSIPDFESGDKEYYQEDLALGIEVARRLDDGDVLAWCIITVTAKWGGFSATDSIGGVSNCEGATEEAVLAEFGGDLKDNALDSLNEVVATAAAQIESLKD